ncbi:unnamed protein product [marine sediment metagenome]|uniref:Uncharacterized protein n=1 Tax=marine sediment metagenome TaxID=412755 RepID=X1R260_9ZZZZ
MIAYVSNNYEKQIMKSKYIILGPDRRLKAKQCTICKFYLPE